uniref:Ras-associating domain-containing protein n=1 Tax=Glossina brevipalpis TaxID=37001 RepID=A0A1A9WX91_9MUSC
MSKDDYRGQIFYIKLPILLETCCSFMLKHVQISPLRNRSDSVSLRSSNSCASSMCGSPEPATDLPRTPSRASSYSSLSDHLPQTTIKVFTSCLKIDIEYKTLGIQWDTTSKEVIMQLLRRLKMRHRDPRLFYLSMEVSVRRAGVKTVLVLDDDTRPAVLQACHPKGESRFYLQLKPGGLIRVHTSELQPSSQYKSLVISEETTSDELLQLLLSCYNSPEPVEQFSIYEVCPGQEYQRKLHPDDIPLRAQAKRAERGEVCHFLVRRNPNYLRHRQVLTTLDEVVQNYTSRPSKSFDTDSSLGSLDENTSLLDVSIESLSDDMQSLMTSSEEDDCASISSSSDTSNEVTHIVQRTPSILTIIPKTRKICTKSHKNYKSCDFCFKNPAEQQASLSYSPVYNIREIRSVAHSFSPLGNDKKYLDFEANDYIETVTNYHRGGEKLYRNDQRATEGSRMILDATNPYETLDNTNDNITLKAKVAKTQTMTLLGEEVNNNPAKGLGHFIYI